MRLGLKTVRLDQRASDPRADAIRHAAERSRRVAERSRRRRAALEAARSLRADCDSSYLLTGVFSAPASGIFVRRLAEFAGGTPASSERRPTASRPASFCEHLFVLL